jgi:RNA polymerase sigma factor (sigma-70 family)
MHWDEFYSEINRSYPDFQKRLCGYFWVQHRIQQSDADDIVQHAIIELIENRVYEHFEPRHQNSFWGWIKKSVSLSWKNWWRHRKWCRKHLCSLVECFDNNESNDNEIAVPIAYLDGWTPYRALESARVVLAVRQATALIPALQMDLFERHYIHGESVRELAKEVGMSEKALASSLRRVRLKLQCMLAAYNPRN